MVNLFNLKNKELIYEYTVITIIKKYSRLGCLSKHVEVNTLLVFSIKLSIHSQSYLFYQSTHIIRNPLLEK